MTVLAPELVAQELPFQRDYPGAGPSTCPVFEAPSSGSEEARAQAGQLASSAAQAVILGDLERAGALLERAAELDPASADVAYRRARVLEDSGETEEAVVEYCRTIALAGDGSGARDAQARLDAIAAAERGSLPDTALAAFQEGLAAVDEGSYRAAAEAFAVATNQAPSWAGAAYNRGVALDRLGQSADAAGALLRYLELRPDAPDAIAVSQRIGQLQSLAVSSVPSPGAALALGTLLPGVGHFYAGRPVGGFTVLALVGGAVAAGFLIEDVNIRCLNPVEGGGTCPPDQVVSRETERPYMMAGLGAAAAVSVVGAVEAFFELRGRRARARALPSPSELETAEAGPVLEGPSLSTRFDRVDLSLLRLRFR
ncbi:MAG: tetratricopeptide repeat protein [Gemmatimonadota bacterium]